MQALRRGDAEHIDEGKSDLCSASFAKSLGGVDFQVPQPKNPHTTLPEPALVDDSYHHRYRWTTGIGFSITDMGFLIPVTQRCRK